MNIKQLLAVALFGLMTTQVDAVVKYQLSDFEDPKGKGDVGFVTVDGESYFKLGMSPDLKLGPIDLGVDLALYLGGDGKYPKDLNWISLRYLGFDLNKRHGVKWGYLRNLTLGQGLLMNNYDTSSGLTTSGFSMEHAGAYGYTTIKNLRTDVLWTPAELYAGRLQYRFDKLLFGLPVNLGATYVTDQKGVDRTLDGNSITRPKQDGYAADISIPVGGELFTPYVEYAELVDQGNGASAGFRGNAFGQLGYRLEYRMLGKGFVPGYFDSSYQGTSFSFANAPTEKISGILGAADVSFMKDYAKAGLMYEKYDDRDLLTAAIGWQKIGNTVGVINYRQPFMGSGNTTADAEILWITGKMLDYVIGIHRIYITSDTYTESYDIAARFNLDKVFPSLPFQ